MCSCVCALRIRESGRVSLLSSKTACGGLSRTSWSAEASSIISIGPNPAGIWTAHNAVFGVLRLGAASVIKSVAWCALRQICAPCVSRKQINANVFSNKTFLKSKTDISSEQIEIGNHSNSLSNQSHQSDFASIISDPIEHIKNRIDQSRITTQS